MLVARTPPSPSPRPYFAARDFAQQGPSPSNSEPHFRNGRPDVFRRPSALRKASSDHIICPAVTRFDTRSPAYIPPASPGSGSSGARSVTASTAAHGATRPSVSRVEAAPSSSSSVPGRRSPSADVDTAATAPWPPVRPALSPLGAITDTGAPATSGSLLARRRSSRSAARADVLPMLSDLSLKGALPTAGLALDELDDTVRPAVIGESSLAQTPASEAASPVLVRGAGGLAKEGLVAVEAEFKPTKSFVSTPFPGKRGNWLSDEDELYSPVQPEPSGREDVVGAGADDACRRDEGEA